MKQNFTNHFKKNFINKTLVLSALFFSVLHFNLSAKIKINKNVFQDAQIQAFKIDNNPNSHTFQLFSHGRSGELLLNGKWCNAQEIATFLQPKIQNSKFKIQNLNVYGCEFAKGAKGLQAVAYLQKTLGVSVSASNNITGKDGDWVLEVGKSKDVIAVNNYYGNLQSCPNGSTSDMMYASNSVGNTGGGSTLQGSSGAPDFNFIPVYDVGTAYQTIATYPSTFVAGDSVYITGLWNSASWPGGVVLAFSADNITYSANSSAINGFNSTAYTTIGFQIPAGITGNLKYIRIQGAASNTLLNIDAIGVAIPRCKYNPINGTAFLDNGIGGGTASNCTKDGTESGTIFSSGMYAKIKTVGGLSAISAAPLNADGTFTISDVANGTYVVYLDNNNNLVDFTPTNPTNYNGVISQTVTVTNGVVSPALNLCLTFKDSDGDGIGDDTDLDDDNDGVLDVVENGCSTVITPTSASSSTNWSGGPASNTIASLGLTGTGLSAQKGPLTFSNTFLMLDPNLTGWIDYNMAANTSINEVALWATKNPTSWVGGDAPIKEFQVEVTFSGGVWTSGTYSTANPNLPTNTSAQIFDLGQTFNNVTKIRIKILTGWYNVGNDGVTYVSTLGQPNFTYYNMTLAEFRAVNTCTADIDTDGDGIPNRLDLDSDNDGCSDAYESGVTALAGVSMTSGTSGTVGGTTLANSVVNGPYSGNGFADILQASPDTNAYKAVYTYSIAINSAVHTCPVCGTGTLNPAVTPTTATNTCPVTTVNITTLASTGITPVGTTKIWSLHNPPTSASDTLTTTQASAVSVAGKYYTLYYDKVVMCYSPADSVVVSITSCATVKPTPDAGTAPATGGTAIANVAANDSVNGQPAVIGTNATIATSGTWPAGITLNTATGKVSVAAGTAPGVYPVSYTLCDTATPTPHCATITDTITITAVIKPTPDAGTAPATGGTAIANVAANDSVNGQPAVIGTNATIATSGTWPAGITLNTATGKVSVAAGTAPGVYPVSYTLCDTATPTPHCATITDTITITAVIKPTPDAGTAPATGGTAIANVAANDSVNGHPAVIGTNATIATSGTWPAGITLNTATGKVSVAAGTAPGVYPVSYTLCDTATPTPHCATITDTITITAVIKPTPDAGTAPATGGTAIANVAANDSVNGHPAVIGTNATIATSGTWPAGITLNTATGKVSVAAGTAPGVYPVSYTLCDTATPTPHCATITDTITITAVIKPTPDAGTAPATGGTAIANVAANDSVNGHPAVIGTNATIATSGTWPTGVTLDPATGKVTVTPGTLAGVYPVSYTLCDTSTPTAHCATISDTVTVKATPDTVTVKPTCPTCPLKACVVANDITINSSTTYSSCGLSASQAGKGTLVLDLNGCLIFQGNGTQGALDTIKTCVVACNGTVCDTTYINIAPAKPPYGPDTINVTPACGTCTITPICATGDDLPASTGTPTVTTCGLTPAQSALGTLTLNSSGCAIWTPNGTKQTDTIKTCIIKCVTPLIPGAPVCDTTKIWIAPPPTPDYDTVTPACPTCPVKVCPVANDIHINSATTFSSCGAPSGYTITGGPSTAGCYTFTPLSPMPTMSVTTCVVACNGTVCDTTYVVINPPVSPDSVITTPACPTCPVKVCTIGDDIAVHTGATYTTCGAPTGYTQAGPDANGCYTYTPTGAASTTTVTTCQVICKNGICDTTYLVINPPAPEKNNDVNITGVNTLVNGNVHTNDVVPAGTTYGPPTPNPSNPTGGVLNFSPDGSYTFIAPTPGVYKFIVPVCAPGQSLPCPTTELDITVLDPNTTTNPPVANTDLGTTKGTNPVTINSLANDLSGNLGGTLDPTSVVVTTPPAHGTYSVNPTTGAITYTPTAGFTGKDTLYYSVKDANGNTSIAMQVITVLPSDAGNTTTATDDYASAGKGQNATGNVKINDIDPEGNTTSVTPLDSTIAGVGRFVIDASGNYTFTPVPGFTGPISVPYTITDANGAKASATVHILISNLVAPLNVNWLGFNVSNTHCLANLVWQVSSLANTSYFEIQKSSNSAIWTTIGKITDIDRTKLEAQFTYTDNELLTSANRYYRLKEIELNGNTNYSEVRYANCKEGYSINIYPNPVEDKLTISFTRESELEPTILIYNMAGQRVQTNLIKNTNNKELVFSLSHLASGVYTIIINDNDFGKSTYKVMKK